MRHLERYWPKKFVLKDKKISDLEDGRGFRRGREESKNVTRGYAQSTSVCAPNLARAPSGTVCLAEFPGGAKKTGSAAQEGVQKNTESVFFRFRSLAALASQNPVQCEVVSGSGSEKLNGVESLVAIWSRDGVTRRPVDACIHETDGSRP